MKQICLVLCIFFAESLAAEEFINLRSNPVLVRAGFEQEWTMHLPSQEEKKNWIQVDQGFGKYHSLMAHALKIPDPNPRSFLSLDDSAEETFSYVFHFSLDSNDFDQDRLYGILLGSVGIRWQCYLNGNLVHDKSQEDSRNVRFNYLFPIPSQHLTAGDNVLLFKIIGSRSNNMTGFNYAEPYLLGKYDSLVKIQSEIPIIIIITIFFMIGLFHFLLFFKKRKEIHNLFYTLFSLSLSAFILSRTDFISHYIPDSMTMHRIQAFTFYSLPILGIGFFRSLFQQKFNFFDKVMIVLNLCLMVAVLLFSQSWIYDSVTAYKYFLPILSLYVLVDLVGREFIKDLMRKESIRPDEMENIQPIGMFFRILYRTVSGNLLIGTFSFVAFMIIDIVDMGFLYKGLFLSQYGFVAFVFSIAFSLTNRFLKVNEMNEKLNSELESKFKELEYSDRKYRFLVEGTTDLLFILNSKYDIISINSSARKYFGLRPDTLIGKNFIDLLYTTSKDKMIIHQLAEENLRQLNEAGKQVKFRSRIRSSSIHEPLELFFHIEAVDTGDNLEFIGKGNRSFEDSLTSQIVKESQVYQIDNYILMADELSQRLVRVISKKLPDYKTDAIRTGLKEMLINAIEHGNLNITFEEKSQHLSKGDYLQLINSRQKDMIYGSRKVRVEYELTDHYVSYLISDEGNGFDYKELMMKASANQSLGREHGRGIMLAENIFDSVEYQGKGNSVYLKVNFSETKGKKHS
ncbi:ATP-binding protein [Leptospira sp. GIMC2001]|uniref:ATP-binding protein n=1 Tax=Leptospira sp. GIMC2001 TaxID=1513297 RepID=UPI002349CC7B|nr:ATP-binding protein [Leptospira sp. GIMC2001]WCL47623.1 ATP-binding protein [Leptospira sp. GIMC2001]